MKRTSTLFFGLHFLFDLASCIVLLSPLYAFLLDGYSGAEGVAVAGSVHSWTIYYLLYHYHLPFTTTATPLIYY